MADNPPQKPRVDVAPFTISMPATKVDWPTLFGTDNSVEVEIEVGSGKGLFLVNAAQQRPERRFLGIEMAKKYAHVAAERIAKRNLINVKILPGDARLFLQEKVPPASVAAVHIYFPDPWWKKRHRKRRVFCDPFVADVARVLVPGGNFEVVTDVEEYFGVMMDLMATHPEFISKALPAMTAAEHDLDYLTNFERKYRIEGRPIYRSSYQRS